MKKFIFCFFFIQFTFAQIVPCSDLKKILGDSFSHYKDAKGEIVETNDWTGISEYKYHFNFDWAQSACIKDALLDDNKHKIWGEIKVGVFKTKDEAIKEAEYIKEQLHTCFTKAVDKTHKSDTQARDYSAVLMVNDEFSWTDIEVFVNHTTTDQFTLYIIF